MIYTVDGNPVNDRTDWRHTRVPRWPQSQRVGMFPGVAELFVVRDAAMPGGVRTIGFLQGIATSIEVAVQNLSAEIAVWDGRLCSRSLHSVVIHADSFPEVFVQAFQQIGPVMPFRTPAMAGNQFAVKQPVEIVWMSLK